MTSGRSGDQEERQEQQTAGTAASSVSHASGNNSASTATATTDANSSAESNANAVKEHIRKFVFTSGSGSGIGNGQGAVSIDEDVVEKLEIKIPELLQGGYSFYTWPSAPILAWFLWERRHALAGKRILELGAGTALPGILAAKCGARVLLSDSATLLKSLAHIRKACRLNNLIPGEDIDVIGLSWGLLLNSVFNLGSLDLVIGADCFYDPAVFEDILVTVAFLLERNPNAKFLFTYQDRSADWSIEALLKKWRLHALHINIDDIGRSADVDLLEFMAGHTIHLIEITQEH